MGREVRNFPFSEYFDTSNLFGKIKKKNASFPKKKNIETYPPKNPRENESLDPP